MFKNFVWFHIKDGESWRNVRLKYRGATLDEAKQWVKDNWEAISARFEIVSSD